MIQVETDIQEFSRFHHFRVLKTEKYLREIDNVLSAVHKQTNVPVIIGGVKKEIAKFNAITKNGYAIIGSIEGNFDRSSIQEVLEKTEPLLLEHQKMEHQKIINLLDKALSKGICVSGIKDVWKAVMEKQGSLLVVEKGYRFSGKAGKDKFTLIPVRINEKENPIINDAVDDIIEFVFLYGGDVVFVEDGVLGNYERIALVTYF